MQNLIELFMKNMHFMIKVEALWEKELESINVIVKNILNYQI